MPNWFGPDPTDCGCCGNDCWDCPYPASYSISCADPCFDLANGTYAVTGSEFTGGTVCESNTRTAAEQELYLWHYPSSVWTYVGGSTLSSGDWQYVSLCDGSDIDIYANPQPASPYNNLTLGDTVFSIEHAISLISAQKARVRITFDIGRQVFIETTFAVSPARQFFYSRDRTYEFVFEKTLTSCATTNLTALSTTVTAGNTKGWGLINPAADSGALSTTASDFTVAVQF